jgi:septum formation protein
MVERLLLASTSQSRQQMLRAAGVVFDVMASGVDEEELKLSLKAAKASPRTIADALAETKAVKVSARYPDRLVLGADTVLSFGANQMFDKPATLAEARAQLLALRGQDHVLISAAVMARGGRPVWRFIDTPRLTVRNFSESFIDQYLAQAGDAILSSVGAYHLEGLGAQLFARVSGDYFSILGLPLLAVLDYLRQQKLLVD